MECHEFEPQWEKVYMEQYHIVNLSYLNKTSVTLTLQMVLLQKDHFYVRPRRVI